jgi:ribosomal protein S18 acetylase RimI-like enzyme
VREAYRSGKDYLDAATTLLRRVRSAHVTAGLLEAADLQWWWRASRRTDDFAQLFWFDEQALPVAAVVFTDWGDGVALDPISMPDASPGWFTHVVERGIEYAAECGFGKIDVVADRSDEVVQALLRKHNFSAREGVNLEVVCAWRAAAPRPEISALPDGYRLCSRVDTLRLAHHMIARNGHDVEARLRQTSLYRPDLDLLVLDPNDQCAAYSLLWFDPVTATGMIEPMRTEDAHQRRGLARHLLTAGINRLAEAGARRVKICYSPHNPVAKALYLSEGFEPFQQTVVWTRE